MAERAVFLDRDNTIIENDGYLGDPSKVKLLPGAGSALTAIRALGYRLIVVSNQSGVARGLFDEAAVEAVNNEMSRQLQQQASAFIDAMYYCPYHPDAPLADYRVDHDWRKPKPGMLKQAAVDFSLDLAQCWMIGDQPRDVAAGVAAGCRTILLRDGDRAGLPPADADARPLSATPSFVVRTLADAARILAREGRHNPAVPRPAPPAIPAAETPIPRAPATPAPAAESQKPSTATVSPAQPASPTPAAVSAEKKKPAVESPPPSHPTPGPVHAEPPASLAATPQPVPATTAPSIAPPPVRLEKQLEELVTQMRQQNRHADLHPEFSLSNIAALILQILAFAAFILGCFRFFTAQGNFKNPADLGVAVLSSVNAVFWLLAAAVLQGSVIALLLHHQHKHTL